MSDYQKSNKASTLSKINFFLIVIFGALVLLHEVTQEGKIYWLSEGLQSIYNNSEPIDFSISEIQHLEKGFLLASASQTTHLTGVKFSGRIINTKSVDHTNVAFEIQVDGQEKEFTISKISAGNSTGFSVYIPEIDIANARYARVTYSSSNISFLAD